MIPPLFGTEDVAAGASVVACFLAAITGLFAWLTARDKLRYDVRMVQLESNLAGAVRDVAECRQDRDSLRVTVAGLEATNARQQRQLDSLERRADVAEQPKSPEPHH